MILAEFFVAGGVSGIMGSIMVIFSLIKLSNSILELVVCLILFIGCISLLFYLLIKAIPKDKLNSTLFLNRELNKDNGFISNDDKQNLVGQYAITTTILRPIGKIKVNGEILNATSEDKFVDKEKQVLIVGFDGTNIIIREV